MKRIALLIPDAGPLISLARGGALDTLLLIDVPIYVVDEVLFETTRDKSFPDAQAIEDFVNDNARVHVFETEVGKLSAMMREKDPTYAPKGQGEAAIAQMYARVDEVVDPLSPIMVLFEDSDTRRIQIIIEGNVWLLSTKSFLIGLEERGLISSAEQIWNAIHEAERYPSESEVERKPEGYEPSFW